MIPIICNLEKKKIQSKNGKSEMEEEKMKKKFFFLNVPAFKIVEWRSVKT